MGIYPDVPDLAVTPFALGTNNLVWSEPSYTAGTVQSYEIYGGEVGGSLSLLSTVGAGTFSYADTGLCGGQNRSYVVTVTSLGGTSQYTSQNYEYAVGFAGAPDAPGLSLDSFTAAQAELELSAPSCSNGPVVTEYRLEADISDGSGFTTLQDSISTDGSLSVSVTGETSYDLRLIAINDNGDSAASSTISFTTGIARPTVSTLTVADISSNEATAAWVLDDTGLASVDR